MPLYSTVEPVLHVILFATVTPENTVVLIFRIPLTVTPIIEEGFPPGPLIIETHETLLVAEITNV